MKKRRYSYLILVLILTTLALPQVSLAAGTPTAVVSPAALNVREGPGTGYTILTVAHAGDELAITGQSGSGWLQVSLAGGTSGWVSDSYVVVSGDMSGVPTVAAPATTVKTSLSTGATGQASAGSGHTIVFQLTSGGTIYAVNPDGSNLRVLTTGMDPAISPDGKQVAFTRWDGSSAGVNGSLWVINIDGTGERMVNSGSAQAKSPTWSPDGTRVVISLQKGGTTTETYLCIVDGKRTEVPQPIPGQRCLPQRPDPHWRLRLVNMADGSYQDLEGEQHTFAPTWDPANAWHVVFRGDKGLESLDLNQNTIWVLKAIGAYRGPSFSPDASKIAVTYKQVNNWEVHVMNADGSNEVRLTETPQSIFLNALLKGTTATAWNNAAPAWSPDGSQIAFITDRSGQYELWVMNADGSNQHALVTTAMLGGANFQYDGVDERVISWR